MRRVLLFVAVTVTLFACKKRSEGPTGNNFQIGDQWRLEATASYHVPGGQTSWQTAGGAESSAVIEFTDDSVFSFNANYTHPEQQYDRYKTIDSTDFEVYATQAPQGGNFPIYHATVMMPNPDTIELQYMGVDAGLLERYVRQ